MDGPLFTVNVLVNRELYAKTLIDDGCSSYGLIDSKLAARLSLPRIPIKPRAISGFENVSGHSIQEVAYFSIDVGGMKHRLFAYVVPKLLDHDLILGKQWMKHYNAIIDPTADTLEIRSVGISLPNEHHRARTLDCKQVSAASYHLLVKGKQRRRVEAFAVSMADIEKALSVKKHTDPGTKLPSVYKPWLSVFDRKEAERLPPFRGSGVDHKIEITKDKDGRSQEVPWGPLYGMSRDELLVLRKTLTELLDRGFIRVSNSPAASPVLFVKKPGGGLRFCVDYRALNSITRKDRYPLPLIQETLNNISRAKWFTKLDVIAAFHNIRIAEGDEWKTAFRTRYGLYEWLVTPFGLANAPSTFQRYINWTLRNFLDDFCSAYVDDILIYTDGSRAEHEQQVKRVLARLQEAGLRIDIDKCEFSVQSTKYLGFIIEAGKGIRMDPQKVQAIQSWQQPTTLKGVQGFLGFANFYRRFIHDYSKIAAPLTALTKNERKGEPFRMTEEAVGAFEALKDLFSTAPVLAQFDPDRETRVETDSSGYCSGGTLSQQDDDGAFRPVAYFSKKYGPAECNYEIHDKEMLAIIHALKAWNSELRSVGQFRVVTDHKNLEYFMSVKRLSERQMRWRDMLSQFDFTIEYRPGTQNQAADALSRREQDLPVGQEDERFQAREMRLLDPKKVVKPISCRRAYIMAAPARTEGQDEATALEDQWQQAKANDGIYLEAVEAIQQSRRTFPAHLHLRVSIADCTVVDGGLLYRERLWVPNNEPLRTKILQSTHDSELTGHPGKEGMSAILRRKYFWPGMHDDVKRFVRNCDSCGANKVWRTRKSGLLRPLPVPERIWQEISVDYITDLPKSSDCRHILVITDRLGKGALFSPCQNLETETFAKIIIQRMVCKHGVPTAITSDRGSQFVNPLWKRVCELLGIEQRLSTAYHPETDGATERANQVLEEYLRHFTAYYQNDWAEHLPYAEFSVSIRDAASTGVSPFFLEHGYHPRLGNEVELPTPTAGRARNPRQAGEQIVARLKEAVNFAQACMAEAQQRQEDQANRRREPAPAFRVGDKVWLDLRNVKTQRPCKKLDARSAKYTITEAISGSAYRLDTPPGIHNVFSVSLLRPAASDPFPSQIQTDVQPGPIIADGEDWYNVESIRDHRWKRGRGRGGPWQQQVLVQWTGYQQPTWESRQELERTDAFRAYERTHPEVNERNPQGKGG